MESVLCLPGLGIHDDFFALGGHSLLAARLTSRLNQELSLNLPLRTLFEASTTEKLGLAVQKALASDAPKRKPVNAVSNRRTAPLTPMQERIRFVEAMQPGRVLYNTPSAHRLAGPMNTGKFEQAFNELLKRQSALRTRIGPNADGTGYLQIIEEPSWTRLAFEDLTGFPAAKREEELMSRMQRIVDTSIDIQETPLFRAVLYKMAEQEHVFLFMPHHIIWDGWSFDLLYDEMAAIYSAVVQDRGISLPALPITYGDYAHWFADWLEGPESASQLQYWKQRFAKAPTPKAPVPDYPRRSGMSGEGATEWVHINKELTEQLREVARRADSTLNMLTLAVYTVMMASVVEDSSIVIGLPVRGRSMPEAERIMGFFNNLLPVQFQVDRSTTVVDFVRNVKQELLEVFGNQDVPFERIAIEPEVSGRSQSQGIYQALFSFQDARERKRQWGELNQTSVLLFQKGATEDLGLWLMEVPGGLEGGFTYNADIYSQETAKAFRQRYYELIERLVAEPTLTLAELTRADNSDASQHLRRIAPSSENSKMHATVAAASRRPQNNVPLPSGANSIAKIWAPLLGLSADQMRQEDSFQSLGGTLDLAEQAVEKTEAALGFRLEPARYMSQTLEQLANAAAILGTPPKAQAADRSKAEQELADIWSSLLGIDAAQISSKDNFFDLGGNSLLAMQALAESERRLALKTDPRRYVYETLRQLAAGAGPQDVSEQMQTSALPQSEPKLLSRLFGRIGRRS
jgi:acyl carrier protein